MRGNVNSSALKYISNAVIITFEKSLLNEIKIINNKNAHAKLHYPDHFFGLRTV